MNSLSKLVHLFLLLLLLVLVVSNQTKVASTPDDLVVNTNSGKIRGAARATGGAEFLGIPYAQAPIGNLRWREPLPFKPWQGVRNATSFGAPCAQAVLGDWNKHDSETSSEDCLFLNVITPAWPTKDHLPVMFWIHGGANAGGTASSSLYKDGTLVNHGVILVTVNYRLSVFGFFSHAGLTEESSHHASGNYGLLDQLAALRWVHNNIANFGGDPNNVTVFGQSAGAQDTSLLAASPLAKGLFHRAIVQSGSAINPPCPPLAQSEKSGARLASILKAAGDNKSAVKFLRGVSVKDLLAALGNQDPTQPPMIGPNIDGLAITKSPDRVFAEKQQLPIPMILGTTTREFTYSAPIDQLRQFIEGVTGKLSPKALSLYGLDNNGTGKSDPVYGSAGDQWFSDLIFRCPVSIQATWHSTLNNSTYQYELAHAIPGHESEGALHSTDLPYVFGYYPKTGNISGNFGELDFKLADLIETYWTNFAKTGDPNSAGLPRWASVGATKSFIRFEQDGNVTPVSGGLRSEPCDLLFEVLRNRMAREN